MKKQINNSKIDKQEFENELDNSSKEFVDRVEDFYIKADKSSLNKGNKALLIERMNPHTSIAKKIFSAKIPAYYAAAALLLLCASLLYNSDNIVYRDNYIVKKDTMVVEKEVLKTITKEVKVNKYINRDMPIGTIKTIYDDSIDLSYISASPIARNMSSSLMNNLESVQNAKKGFTAGEDTINKIIGNVRYY